MADRRIIDLTNKTVFSAAYVEIDDGIASYRQSIHTLVSSVVAAYVTADQVQNTSLGLNADSSMPAFSSTNYLDSESSHKEAIEELDSQLGSVSANTGGTTYSNNYVVSDGTDHEEAIGDLDAGLESLNSAINAVSVANASVGATQLTVKITPAILNAILGGTAYNVIDLALAATGRRVKIHDLSVDIDHKGNTNTVSGDIHLCYTNTYSASSSIVEIPQAVLNASADGYYDPSINKASLVTVNTIDKDIYLVKETGSSVTTLGDTEFYLNILYSTYSRDESIAPTE